MQYILIIFDPILSLYHFLAPFPNASPSSLLYKSSHVQEEIPICIWLPGFIILADKPKKVLIYINLPRKVGKKQWFVLLF